MRITDEVRFTEGDCNYLARAIQKLTGWPIYAFYYEDAPDVPNMHAFVRTPDGKALDVFGVCEMNKMIAQWSQEYSVDGCKEFTWADFKRTWEAIPAFGDYTYRRAKIVAQRLVAEHG